MIYALSEELVFPPPHLANSSGILAVGGDLSIERLLLAYQMGIFPWYSPEEPIVWWSPNPRFVLYPDDLKVSKSMRQVLRKGLFSVTYDQDFPAVIRACKRIPRPYQDGTWITDEMEAAYIALHEAGFAHSVEVWRENRLVGGLYGISLGKCFFGESMFSRESNASKTGFITLVQTLKEKGFGLIDCQVYTDHLASLGAVEVTRSDFLWELERQLDAPTIKGNWGEIGK